MQDMSQSDIVISSLQFSHRDIQKAFDSIDHDNCVFQGVLMLIDYIIAMWRASHQHNVLHWHKLTNVTPCFMYVALSRTRTRTSLWWQLTFHSRRFSLRDGTAFSILRHEIWVEAVSLFWSFRGRYESDRYFIIGNNNLLIQSCLSYQWL